jgi:hypothetical protein
MTNCALPVRSPSPRFALHGWLGLGLIAIFWPLNWLLPGPRTHWGFFPLWLGYCLTIDAWVLCRRGTSLLNRDWRKYVGLFLISAPAWWLFEVLNWRLQNWLYLGRELFSDVGYTLLATFSFSTVIPAVFGTAELMASFDFIRRMRRGPVIRASRILAVICFVLGLAMFALMLAWPVYFFPCAWLSAFLIIEPINIWLGHRSLTSWTRSGDWRPVVALWLGVLMCAFFWEMWNFFAYPKWVYRVPWVGFWHIFEMPLLGYGGYLPFALELYALYHLIVGLIGHKDTDYVHLAPEASRLILAKALEPSERSPL